MLGRVRRTLSLSDTDGNDIVVENQFDKADWDHWGRLEAYARLKKATVAVLVAESFEELMIVTCNLRNEDSEIGWYLIQAHANAHHELSFHHVVQPAIDIQVLRKQPVLNIVNSGNLFVGKTVYFPASPVPVKYEGRVEKRFRGVILALQLSNHRCSIQLSFQGADRMEYRRRSYGTIVPNQGYKYESIMKFPRNVRVSCVPTVLDKGKKDLKDWPEIREKLVSMGTDIYNRINESDI